MADVFISYSRKDIAFAHLIYDSLRQSQIDTWIDWERIPIGVHWWQEICDAIENANVLLFIISKTSIESHVCKDEINHALKNNKRIIPILVDDIKLEAIKEFVVDITQINWIIFQRDNFFYLEENTASKSQDEADRQVAIPKSPQFEAAIEKLNKAIYTDWDWLKFHTKLQVEALRWEENNKTSSYLLKAVDWNEAKYRLVGDRETYSINQAKEHAFDFEHMLDQRGGKDPELTPIQIEFLQKHRSNELIASKWYWHKKDDNEYHAMDHDYVCYRCNYIYVFTPADHEPIPKECPACGFPRLKMNKQLGSS
ncbi:MAG: toll/interleukin-1 receptor domain-containing protein [Anaerolineaceae bacterium]|nr:toll/interleukin-1 receptor domain-containing protein [Anaerolineaceae bacterium]